MIWIIVAAIVATGIFLIYRRWLFAKHQEQFALEQFAQGFPIIQKNAFNNVYEHDRGILPFESDQYFQTIENFGVAYTITRSPDKAHFIHHISGKAPGKPDKAVVQNMLLVMLFLVRQFKAANFTEEPRFGVERSELGTHLLEFQLTARQHAALRSATDQLPRLG